MILQLYWFSYGANVWNLVCAGLDFGNFWCDPNCPCVAPYTGNTWSPFAGAPFPPHLSIPASSTRSRFRLIVIPSQNGFVRSLQQGPPSAPGRGRTGYIYLIERSGPAALQPPLTPTLHRPVTLGLSPLPFSSTQCLSWHSASTPRWRPTVSRAKTPKPS